MGLNHSIARDREVRKKVRALYESAIGSGKPEDPIVFVNALDFEPSGTNAVSFQMALMMDEAREAGEVGCLISVKARAAAHEEMQRVSERVARALLHSDPQTPITVLIMTGEGSGVLHLPTGGAESP